MYSRFILEELTEAFQRPGRLSTPNITVSPSPSNLSVSDINTSVAFYAISERKREVLFLCSVPVTTLDSIFIMVN
jgi:hypothetical protein